MPAASGFRIFMRFFTNRASTQYASTRYARTLERGVILACKNTFADSKVHCLVACKYSKQRKRAASGLTLNAGFLTQLVGKRVGRGRCGPNPRKAGHLVCLLTSPMTATTTSVPRYSTLVQLVDYTLSNFKSQI